MQLLGDWREQGELAGLLLDAVDDAPAGREQSSR